MSEHATVASAIVELLERERPELFLRGVFEYSVAAVGARLGLVPVRASKLLPQLPLVDQWGAAGVEARPAKGARVVVAFLDGDAARPVVIGHLPMAAPGGVPTLIKVDADALELCAGAGAVVRDGDTVSVGSTTGVISVTSGTAESPPAISRVKA